MMSLKAFMLEIDFFTKTDGKLRNKEIFLMILFQNLFQYILHPLYLHPIY